MSTNKKSQAGFTLVEMTVIAGVISVLAVGFSAYMYQQTKHLNAGTSRESINQLQMNMLNASGKADVLTQSEGLQKATLATIAPITGCAAPCSSAYDEDGTTPACVYDCRDPGLHGVCSVLEAPCKYIFVTQCTCSAGSNRGGDEGGSGFQSLSNAGGSNGASEVSH